MYSIIWRIVKEGHKFVKHFHAFADNPLGVTVSHRIPGAQKPQSSAHGAELKGRQVASSASRAYLATSPSFSTNSTRSRTTSTASAAPSTNMILYKPPVSRIHQPTEGM